MKPPTSPFHSADLHTVCCGLDGPSVPSCSQAAALNPAALPVGNWTIGQLFPYLCQVCGETDGGIRRDEMRASIVDWRHFSCHREIDMSRLQI
jgi:hypothetical protein